MGGAIGLGRIGLGITAHQQARPRNSFPVCDPCGYRLVARRRLLRKCTFNRCSAGGPASARSASLFFPGFVIEYEEMVELDGYCLYDGRGQYDRRVANIFPGGAYLQIFLQVERMSAVVSQQTMCWFLQPL